jgi:tetratricopeptide (TPR) repeat protein
MNNSPASQDPRQQLLEQARVALASDDWPQLERDVSQLLEAAPDHPELLDLLGHALLMQGKAAQGCVVLQKALLAGNRSFWTPHKLGDAQWALQCPEAALEAYEQALAWGSDSPLTSRNLLEALHTGSELQAIARLERFAAAIPPPWDWQDPEPWLRGACAAALRVQGPALAVWLLRHGCPDPAVRSLVWHNTLFRLDFDATLDLLADSAEELEQRLGERLGRLLEPG